MNRFSLLFCFFLLKNAFLSAQAVNFDSIVTPLAAKSPVFSEYLVQLAWLNNPESAIAQDESLNAKDADKNVRKEWMRDVQGTFNLNEANLKRVEGPSGNVFFPRYNFGVNLNLFNILSQKKKNSISSREIRISEHEINRKKLELRNETLSRYAKFRLAKDILKTRTLLEQEMRSGYVLVEQLYRTDEKTFEDYTKASSAYYEAREARMRAETELLVAQLDLESVIGIRWSDVDHPGKDQ